MKFSIALTAFFAAGALAAPKAFFPSGSGGFPHPTGTVGFHHHHHPKPTGSFEKELFHPSGTGVHHHHHPHPTGTGVPVAAAFEHAPEHERRAFFGGGLKDPEKRFVKPTGTGGFPFPSGTGFPHHHHHHHPHGTGTATGPVGTGGAKFGH